MRIALCSFVLLIAAATVRAEAPNTVPVAGPVWFNMDWIETKWSTQGLGDPAPRSPCDLPASIATPDFDDPHAIAEFVLRHTPPDLTVYPSERYFYYRFPLGARLVSGNLRFVDIDKGIIHIGYFDDYNRQDMRIGTIVDGDNAEVDFDADRDLATLRFRGLERTFTLDRSWDDRSEAPNLLEHERLISGVLDESGFYLWLVYNENENALYYLLNEHKVVPDRLTLLQESGPRLLLGTQSRFVFYEDQPTQRRILVSIYEPSSVANDYYDGAFDQVPPDLPIRKILESVYPYVTERGGIDEHGNFVGVQHQRVAISPYQQYTQLDALLDFLVDAYKPEAPGAARWTNMTYESKSHFHETLQQRRRLETLAEIEHGMREMQPATHSVDLSAAWPANHWRRNSAAWSAEHEQSVSARWPANHEVDLSVAEQETRNEERNRDEPAAH